jgi:hypothetical protein
MARKQKFIKPNEYPLFHFMWLRGDLTKLIGHKFGLTESSVSEYGRRFGLPVRRSIKEGYRLRKYDLMIDPPGGHLYGFPMPYSGGEKSLKAWLVARGYPEKQMILGENGEPQYIRMFLQQSHEDKYSSQIHNIIDQYKEKRVDQERAYYYLSGYVSDYLRRKELLDGGK